MFVDQRRCILGNVISENYFSGDYGWHSCDVHGQGRVIYVRRSLQLLARPTKTRSFHHQNLYRKNSSYQCGNFQKICDDKIQVFSIVHQDLGTFRTVPTSMIGVLPVKNLVAKRPCFGRTSPDLEVGVCIWVSGSDIFTSRV